MSHKILITAGGTREYLDPVRFISNASSGQMGYALAEAAHRMGHDVTLITAPTALKPPAHVTTIQVVSAQDMLEAVQTQFSNCDCLIMAAAVSDYTPAKASHFKLKKSKQTMTLELVPTQDILLWAGQHKQQFNPPKIVIGFALEDQDVRTRAEQKLVKKELDMIIANTPDAIGSQDSSLSIKTPQIAWLDLKQADKHSNATLIMQQVTSLLPR